ncbi:unnamed protein product [Urochloa decumbens]|uniref:Uncharacterized protein n=1 Tax=Urochloa decumbens TaxID=240449 RepID=A0ABC8XC67_9POAL
MGGFVSKVRSVAAQAATAVKNAASALWASITGAARAASRYVSALFRAAYEALRRAAAKIPKEAKIAIAVAAGLCLALCFVLPAVLAPAAGTGAMMLAPGGAGGGLMVLRSAFEPNAGLYFNLLHRAGPAVAAASLII